MYNVYFTLILFIKYLPINIIIIIKYLNLKTKNRIITIFVFRYFFNNERIDR